MDEPLVQVLQRPGPARGNHGDGDGLGHGRREFHIIALEGAVPVHAGQENLTGSVAFHPARPFHHIQSCRSSSSVGEDLPSGRGSLAPFGAIGMILRTSRTTLRTGGTALRNTGTTLCISRTALRVDGHHDALGAEPLGRGFTKYGCSTAGVLILTSSA